MLIEQIKQLHLDARKAKNTDLTGFFSLLISEINMVGKNNGNRLTTEAEAIKVVKKFIGNTEELLEKISSEKSLNELTILQRLLPKQLSEAELTEKIDEIIKQNGYISIKFLKNIMTDLNLNYANLYDGKLASNIIKSKLSI